MKRAPNCPLGDTILFGNYPLLFSGRASPANFWNSCFGQFCRFVLASALQFFGFCAATVSIASGLFSAIFGKHISHVFRVGAGEQMAWIYAAWIIARVKNIKAPIKPAIDYLVSAAMGARQPVESKHSVSLKVFSAFPKPAVVWSSFFNQGPKSFRRVRFYNFQEVDCA